MALPFAEVTFQIRPPVIGQLPWSEYRELELIQPHMYHHDAPPRTGLAAAFGTGSARSAESGPQGSKAGDVLAAGLAT